LIASLLAFAFYLAGTKHDFAENTQLFILKIMFVSALSLFIMNVASITLSVIVSIINKNPFSLLLLIMYIVFAALAAALAVFSGAVLVLAGGNQI
jgi:hypothetical protein